ncbi:putative glycoside hydrolase/deacetylase ChbG (UPF0249 family) [Peribacillus deserti]|uniref:Carbohydrate deacetylase n=1 Tax=Peribacillus deserti TaxID=673318 RepID=A0ABS2QHC1_9BACI|nr:chitin disaccharide deacetylase [Peribacillus deserti]MBM7692119.1 putative glycoside hydrolase/deacetylase ChbG (UPF0249 family) [Peribacillus deserti]
MVKLIINADDFGYSNGVNLGIIEAYQNGIVTSATLMANMPGAAHAAALALNNPGLGVGIHLVLDCGFPVHSSVHSLVNEKGAFLSTNTVLSNGDLEEVEKELTSQIEKFLSFGLKPTHLDSHHHVHGHERIFPVVRKLAAKFGIPIRPAAAELMGENSSLSSVQYFNPEFYGDQLSNETIFQVINKTKDYETAEIMTHPAYLDEAILTGSSYALPRVRELAILTAQEVRDFILDQGIELVTYKQIAGQSYV